MDNVQTPIESIASEPQVAPVPNAAAETTPPEPKPDWQVALDEIKAEHKRELEEVRKQAERLQRNLTKDINKAHAKITQQRAIINEFVPEIKREQFRTDDEFKAAQATLEPIRTKVTQFDREAEQAEQAEREQMEREQYIGGLQQRMASLPPEQMQAITNKYQAAITAGTQYDVDHDIMAFVGTAANGPQILDALYTNPEQVVALKRMPAAAKVAALVNLSMSVQAKPQATQPAPIAAPITTPAAPPRGGSPAGKSISDFRSAQEMLEWRRKQKR